MASDEHTHLYRVPEPLEKIFSELEELEKVAGAEGAEDARRVRGLLQEAVAAQARGAVGEASRVVPVGRLREAGEGNLARDQVRILNYRAAEE